MSLTGKTRWSHIEHRDKLSGKLKGVEIVPQCDLRDHISDEECECIPVLDKVDGHLMLIHNSFDGRELYESNSPEQGH